MQIAASTKSISQNKSKFKIYLIFKVINSIEYKEINIISYNLIFVKVRNILYCEVIKY